LTEWFQTTDNGNSSATNDQQDTALDLAASLLIGMTNYDINDIDKSYTLNIRACCI
jgi:hypothetical protein